MAANKEVLTNDLGEDISMGEGIQVVAFKLRDEEYGVNIFQVQEIRNLVDITRI